jgi:hypothetical protein
LTNNGLILGGDPKPLYFFNAFRKGFLSEFQEKILYILLQSIPDEFIQNGWLADEYVLFVIPTIMKCKLKWTNLLLMKYLNDPIFVKKNLKFEIIFVSALSELK